MGKEASWPVLGWGGGGGGEGGGRGGIDRYMEATLSCPPPLFSYRARNAPSLTYPLQIRSDQLTYIPDKLPLAENCMSIFHSPMRPYILWTKGIPIEILKRWRNALATTLDNRQPYKLCTHVNAPIIVT